MEGVGDPHSIFMGDPSGSYFGANLPVGIVPMYGVRVAETDWALGLVQKSRAVLLMTSSWAMFLWKIREFLYESLTASC